MLLPQQGPANCGQQMVVIIVTDVEREVAVNPFQRAGPIQAAGATRAYTAFNGIFRQVLNDVPGTTARQLRLVVPAGLPHMSNVPQPKISGFNIDCALPDVVLNVGIRHLVLRSYVVEREFIGPFCRPQKCRRIMRNETCLPVLGEILARTSYDVVI